MSDYIEQLESRTLFSTSYPAAGTYTGTATPHGHASQAAIIAVTGTKKGGGKVAASLDMTIAENDIVTGSLTLTNVGTYALSGMVVGATVNITLVANGKAAGTFGGTLRALNKKLVGPFTDTVYAAGATTGQTVTGQFNLENSAAIKTKKGASNKQNLALAPGYTPNETPPPITSGIGNSNGSTIGNQTGVTSGDNSGTGTISDGGSLLG